MGIPPKLPAPVHQMLSLPNELLAHIFSFELRRSELADLSMVNKRIHAIARAQLYRLTPIRDPISLHLLMRSVMHNASLRPLVRFLTISAHAFWADGPSAAHWKGKTERSSRAFNLAGDAYEDQLCNLYSDQGLGMLKRLVSESALLGPLSFLPISSSFQAIALLLMQLLPRLQSLEVCHELFIINGASLRWDAVLMGRVFPTLHTFTYGKETYSKPTTIQTLLPIFLVPTIRSITIWSISSLAQQNAASIEPPSSVASHYRTSRVEIIRIYHADLHRDAVVHICSLPQCLKELHYGYSGDPGWHRSVSLGDLGQVLQLLSGTLERLVIQHTYPSEPSKIGSLHQFSNLKKLVIPPHLFLGAQYSPDADLGEFLPKTLQHISLVPSSIRWAVQDYTALLGRIITQKSKRFPKLSVVVLWVTNGAVPYMQLLREQAAAAGVQLGIAHPHNPDQFQVIPLQSLRNDVDAYFHDSFRTHR